MQFSLRALLVLVLLCCVSLWLWDTHIESYRRQRRLILLIEGSQILPASLYGVLGGGRRVSPRRLVLKPGEKISREFSIALHAPVIAKFEDRPLRDVLHYFSDRHGIHTVSGSGIRLHTPVTIDFRGLQAAVALERLFVELDLHGFVADGTIGLYSGPRT